MEKEEGIKALEQIIQASFSSEDKQENLICELKEIYTTRGIVPAKGILAICQSEGDLAVSDETGNLIRTVVFNFV